MCIRDRHTAVDNKIDLLVCSFREHCLLFLLVELFVEAWIMVWCLLEHALHENLEGQRELSWPERVQFRQSL